MIKKHPVIRVMQREWNRIKSKWVLLMVTFVGPLIAFLLVMSIFSTNVPHDLPVAVVDMDHSALSRTINRWTDATAIAESDRSYINLEDARNAMEEGKVDAVLYIPEGTEKAIIKGESSTIVLFLNNANVVKAGLMNSGIRKALSTLSSGIKLKKQLQQARNQKEAMAHIMPIKINSVVLFNPFISYSYFLTLGLMPIILIVFTLLGTTHAIGSELLRGSGPKWLAVADGNIIFALTGKVLPYTFIFTILAMMMNVILIQQLGLPIHGKLHIILVSEFILIVSYQFLAIFFLGLFSNLRLSLSIGSAYCMLALTYSGLTFPESGMPAFGQAIAGIFPFTYWLKIFIGQTLRGEPAAYGIYPMYTMLAFIVLGIMFIPRLKHLLENEHHWGKY